MSQYVNFFIASAGASAAIPGLLLIMAAVGLLATWQLVPRARRAGNFSPGFRTRQLNIAFASISVGSYPVQFGLAIALLASTGSATLQRALVLVIIALYGSALGRAWEVTGMTRRG